MIKSTLCKLLGLLAILCLTSYTFAQTEAQFGTPQVAPITTSDPSGAGAAFDFVMNFPDEHLYVDVYNPDRVFNFTITRREKSELSSSATFANGYNLPVVFFDLAITASNGILPRANFVFRYKYDIISTDTTSSFTTAQRQTFAFMWNTAIDSATSWRLFRQTSESVAETGNVSQGSATNTAAGDLLLKTSIGIVAKDGTVQPPTPVTPQTTQKTTPTPVTPKASTQIQQPTPNPPVNSAVPLYCMTVLFLALVALFM